MYIIITKIYLHTEFFRVNADVCVNTSCPPGFCATECDKSVVNETPIQNCDGKNSCTYDGQSVEINGAADPCVNMFKYTEIKYKCVPIPKPSIG